ncbi:hypothetical protein L2E82_07969 [Cichorium intybus]|uniref:Uncharacterized protein n=2 Tax=Cichorium intybus TaxID=13427 RepID=A0ACB9G6A3_CICIN|nr:hypothetical protein L2E82_07964 [Cichorium intybus]KAI3778590.1 hypothetical protein L2E82_07969 [Cichorium intybus]
MPAGSVEEIERHFGCDSSKLIMKSLLLLSRLPNLEINPNETYWLNEFSGVVKNACGIKKFKSIPKQRSTEEIILVGGGNDVAVEMRWLGDVKESE